MIKLFSLKNAKKDGESPKTGTQKKSSAAQLRIQKGFVILDINELNLPKTCGTEFPDPDDLLTFKLVICPDEGFYKGGRFIFSFKVGPNYPHEPPKVKCETQVYHPNIDLEEPNPEDPLNKDAAEVLQNNRRVFEQNVAKAIRGGYVGQYYFQRCLK
ncbi:PREDICTED: NEDD8-conjugating enzyme Ubc12 isoform X3 [Ceratosolen solmsi marchali]|uniref:E2 NEDD8-conjugating enzyme n=1 Tax=Ceratosolen solmsi marchali TaxID=326594 RepID=A0AAJ6YQS4_9HYME|nr:PREDICTED: NEDD8-conjugating enzyme Ubc12 isoform X3 [Ceratosolen solmsi marchali]